MKSFTLFLVLLFVGLISCQITERNNLYNEINRVRSTYCLSPITIDAELQSATDAIVNARCNNQGFTVPPNTMNLNYNWMGSWTYTDFYNTVKSVYDTSRNSWTCQGDVSLGDTNFIRLSLVPTQRMACSFSSLCGGRYFFQCLFRVSPSFPVLSQCTCGTSGTTTTAPSTTGSSTTGTTTTNNGGTTTTVTTDANGNTVTTVTDANGNRWVTITAPTTAPVNNSPATTAPATPAPVTSAPVTYAPVNNPPTTTTAPSPSNTADSVKNGHMTPINNARSCLGVPLLTWDDNLARNAQAWADALAPTCGSSHAFSNTNPPRNEQEEGENIWQYWADNLDQAITYGTNFWNGEAAYYDCASNTCQGTCGHYTQDISSHSTRMGCAVVRCPSSFDSFGKGKYTGVCRFGKPGNNGQHPLAIAGSCNNFPTCKANLSSKRALTTVSTTKTTSTQSTSTSSFFSSDSQVVVFALAIIIVVLVVAILFILLFSNKKHTNNRELEFKLLESK